MTQTRARARARPRERPPTRVTRIDGRASRALALRKTMPNLLIRAAAVIIARV